MPAFRINIQDREQDPRFAGGHRGGFGGGFGGYPRGGFQGGPGGSRGGDVTGRQIYIGNVLHTYSRLI
jgi:hypothetical protein